LRVRDSCEHLLELPALIAEAAEDSMQGAASAAIVGAVVVFAAAEM
jgi:hypothetical protein